MSCSIEVVRHHEILQMKRALVLGGIYTLVIESFTFGDLVIPWFSEFAQDLWGPSFLLMMLVMLYFHFQAFRINSGKILMAKTAILLTLILIVPFLIISLLVFSLFFTPAFLGVIFTFSVLSLLFYAFAGESSYWVLNMKEKGKGHFRFDLKEGIFRPELMATTNFDDKRFFYYLTPVLCLPAIGVIRSMALSRDVSYFLVGFLSYVIFVIGFLGVLITFVRPLREVLRWEKRSGQTLKISNEYAYGAELP